LYKKNGTLLESGILKGLHHGAELQWGTIKRARVWYHAFGQLTKKYLSCDVRPYGVPDIEYFKCHGRAEPLRMLMAYKGISFTNHYISNEAWAELKKNKKLYPHSVLPVMSAAGTRYD